MLLSLSTILLLTMLLQTLGATNVRVMLPLLVHELGGTDGFFGYIQAVRYFSISVSLVVTPGLVEAARRFRWSDRRSVERAGTAGRVQNSSSGGGSGGGDGSNSSSSADLVPLGLLLPVIAVLNILVCSTVLDLLPYIVGAVEAINSVIYVILSSLSQTVGNRVAFTTRLRLIQSLGSAALGPVTLLLISFVASFVQPKDTEASAAPTALFSMPFYLHATTTAGLFVLLLSAFWSSGPRLHPPAPAVRKNTAEQGNFDGASNNHEAAVASAVATGTEVAQTVHSKSNKTAVAAVAHSEPARGPDHSCFKRGASVIAEVVTDSRTGWPLVTFMVLQSVSSSLGEVVSIGIASHLQHLSEDALNPTHGEMGGDAQITDGASGVVLSDSIASAVAFCAVYVMGVLLDRLIGGEPSPSSSTVNDRSVDGVNIQNQRQRAVVSACLSVLNFTAATGMLLLAVGTSSAQASVAYAVFRTSVRCQQVPTTLLLGLHILDDGPRGRAFGHSRLARLASAFSLFKFVSMVVKVAAASIFATLYADGYALAELSWWSGGALVVASTLSLLQSCYGATRASEHQ